MNPDCMTPLYAISLLISVWFVANNAPNGKIFEIKDNTDLETRKPLNKDLFEKLRKEHKV